MLLLITSIITAFLGYVLPWGQISFWGATVITNLLSATPLVGQILVVWIWGNFSVSRPTLTRFFSLHYLLPFLIIFIVMLHLIFVHEHKSGNPIGLDSSQDKIFFHPYFRTKDIIRAIVFIIFFILINTTIPFILIDPDNFTPGNPILTPAHIQPEWYFLFAYTVLRSVPNKLGGVVSLILSILVLATPLTTKPKTQINRKNPLVFFFYS